MYIHYGIPHADFKESRAIYQFYYPSINRVNFYYWLESQLNEADREDLVAVFRIKLK